MCCAAAVYRSRGSAQRPVFCQEAARGDPTAVAVASEDREVGRAVQEAFNDSRFRVYTNDDSIGVELGGALKNIIAISAGVCDGLGLGHNSVAALITRGLAEMARLVVACGGRLDTMAGLAGLGDLVLTCTGNLSRNRSVGVEPGKGRQTARHHRRHARSSRRRGFHHESRGWPGPQEKRGDADH